MLSPALQQLLRADARQQAILGTVAAPALHRIGPCAAADSDLRVKYHVSEILKEISLLCLEKQRVSQDLPGQPRIGSNLGELVHCNK